MQKPVECSAYRLEVLANQGFEVSGSDLRASATTRHLESLGVTVHVGHAAEQVRGALDKLRVKLDRRPWVAGLVDTLDRGTVAAALVSPLAGIRTRGRGLRKTPLLTREGVLGPLEPAHDPTRPASLCTSPTATSDHRT